MESALNQAPWLIRRQLLGLASVSLLVHSARASGLATPTADIALGVQAAQALKAGRCIVLIRHAITEPGIGDPDGMRLGDCSTQRNLSEQGKVQARQIGDWFRSHQLVPSAIRSSQWCRCLHTAELAFPQATIEAWSPLNSFFRDAGSNRERQVREATAAARSLALRRSVGQFEVWVTHQVVITALTGRYTAPGELVVARYAEGGSQAPLAVLAGALVRSTWPKYLPV